MSYWQHAGPGARNGPSYGTPLLPPRPIAQDSAPPPPLPPRPTGFRYQPGGHSNQSSNPSGAIHRKPVPNSVNSGVHSPISPIRNGHNAIPQQFGTPGHDAYQQYPISSPSIPPGQTQVYSDVSHLFPGGKVPPPPPMDSRQGASTTPQSPVNTNKPEINASPAVSEAGPPASDSSIRTHHQESLYQQQQSSASHDTPVSGDHRQRTDGNQYSTTDTNSHAAYKNPSGGINISQEVNHLKINNNIAAIDQAFQTMGLGSSNEGKPASHNQGTIPQYGAYSPQSPSKPAPVTTQNPPLPSPLTQQPTETRTKTPNPSPKQVQATKECVSTYTTFATIWYAHPRALDYNICSNCYDNHIRGTRFATEFKGTFRDDGTPRGCRFSSPRMKEVLFQSALARGSLDEVVQHMILRPSIPNCVGQGGVQGGSGIKWYKTKNNDIPAMVVCQACYEDLVLVHREFGEAHFEPSTVEHAADQTWACDMAVPYIYREYNLRAATDDWRAFVEQVPARLSLRPCPGQKTVYPDQKWFTPVNGPQGFLICVACYCDCVLLTGQDAMWRDAGDNLVNVYGVSVTCCFGQFNLKALAARTLDTKDHDKFWKAIEVAGREPLCKSQMQGSTWYTLVSNPDGFEICRTCYVTIADPMGVGHHFMPKPGIPPGTTAAITCSFNPGIARFTVYISKLLQMVYQQDPTPLEKFVKEYAFMPTCARDSHVENRRWFGWNECTICAECHHEFVRGTALADKMPHQGVLVEAGIMCEMYSPRMRDLYRAACAADPPDPTPLLEYSVQRRAVFAETMPRVRQILSQIRLNIAKQQALMNTSSFYTWSGNLWQNTLPLEQTYGNAAVGYGHHNHMQIKGAEYGAQATALGNQIRGSPAHIADELEARWRAVE